MALTLAFSFTASAQENRPVRTGQDGQTRRGDNEPPEKPLPPIPMMDGDRLDIRLDKPGQLKDRLVPEVQKRVRRLHIEGTLNHDDVRAIRNVCNRSSCVNDKGRSIDNYIDVDLSRARFTSGSQMSRDKVGYDLFANLSHLRAMRLPNDIRQVDEKAFRDCRKLEEVEMPRTVTHRPVHGPTKSSPGVFSQTISESGKSSGATSMRK